MSLKDLLLHLDASTQGARRLDYVLQQAARSSMTHQRRHCHLVQDLPCHAAEHRLSCLWVPVAPHDRKIGATIRDFVQQHVVTFHEAAPTH